MFHRNESFTVLKQKRWGSSQENMIIAIFMMHLKGFWTLKFEEIMRKVDNNKFKDNCDEITFLQTRDKKWSMFPTTLSISQDKTKITLITYIPE